MQPFLYTETRTPVVHVQTLFADAWRPLCNVSEAAAASMSQQERGDLRVKAAQRLNTAFLLEWSPYFKTELDEDRTGAPGWATYSEVSVVLQYRPSLVCACKWRRFDDAHLASVVCVVDVAADVLLSLMQSQCLHVQSWFGDGDAGDEAADEAGAVARGVESHRAQDGAPQDEGQ